MLDIDPFGGERGLELAAMRGGGDDDRRLAGAHGGAEIGGDTGDEFGVVTVELNGMVLARNLDVARSERH